MGRQPCCDKVGLKKGPWTADEDKKLINFILTNGQCCWRALPKLAGLLRCGKSCRLRWTNYLRPDLKRGLLSEDEEHLVIQLHSQLGNRWSKIASHLPGRTDNEIKNHWNTHIKKKLKKMGIDPLTHKPLPPPSSQSPIDDQEQNNDQEFEVINNNTERSIESSSTITEELVQQEEAEKSPISLLINDFCIDEVPFIQPHEILAPSTSSSPSSSSSSSSSSNSESSYIINSPSNNNNDSKNINNNENNNNMVEGFQELLPTIEWQYDQTINNIIANSNNESNSNNNNIINNNHDDNIGFWDDDFMSSLDLLLNDDDNDKGLLSFETEDLTNYSRMVLDEECLKYEQLL